jgi:hypothetical protein
LIFFENLPRVKILIFFAVFVYNKAKIFTASI